jgi:protein-S-isoprenylcysteine O-methyltransferase Ste14
MNDPSGFGGHYDHWATAAIVVVLASWVLYRFVAPKGWRQWAAAGLVQGFIIALYAEMYGFPLTIYLLSGILGVDVPIYAQTGHLWASLLGYGITGAAIEMALGGVFLLVGVCLLIVGWQEIHRARAEGRLACDGLYRLMRHPQYAGIILVVFGQIVHWPTVATVALFPAIVFSYVRLARKEEREMLQRFGRDYQRYREGVPMFVPRHGTWKAIFAVLTDAVF